MADIIHVKALSAWKSVDFSHLKTSKSDFDGIISFEELTDYEIIKNNDIGGKKRKKTKSGEIAENDVLLESSKGKKMKKGKKAKMSHDSDIVEENGSGGNLEEKPNIAREEEEELMMKEMLKLHKKRKEKQKKKRKQKADSGKTMSEKGTEESINSKMHTNKNVKKQKNTHDSETVKVTGEQPIVGTVVKTADTNVDNIALIMVENVNKEKDIEKLKMKKKLELKKKRKEKQELKKKQKKETQKKMVEDKKTEKKGQPQIKKQKLQNSSAETCVIDESLEGMENWQELFVPRQVMWALRDQGFKEPTPIQAQILPSAIRDQMDIVGAAETGSGKTLAFGIPVLHFILEQKKLELEKDSVDRGADSGVDSMIVDSDKDDGEVYQAVSRDSQNFKQDTHTEMEEKEGSSESEEEELEEISEDGKGCVRVVKDVDMSWMTSDPAPMGQGHLGVTTPRRSYPRALILEPTRELAIQVKNHLQAVAKYTDVKIAAIVGGLALEKQRRILKKCPDVIVATPGRLWELVQEGEVYLSEVEKTPHVVVDEADRMIEKGHFEELSKLLEKMKREGNSETRHTYVFSATLTLIHTGPQRVLQKRKKKMDEKTKLIYLMKKMGLKHKPKVVDLTTKMGTVDSLTEARINCTKEEKDIYLYYFLKQYPGRTLVFANSKDCIRRLVSLFGLLQCQPLPLHADMHQRQRLKNLDRFTANPRGLLLASDVAARGLDIPNVQHVIHYQVPHTVENYVHRSGRTARANKEGLSVMIVGPDDVKNYRKIISTLNKNEDLPMFPTEQEYVAEIRNRVNLVRKIESEEYRFKKKKRQNEWFEKAAEEAGIDIEDEGLLDDIGDDVAQAKHQQYLQRMKHELALMLKQPVHTHSSFTKYPTKSGRLVLPATDVNTKDALTQIKKSRKSDEEKVKDQGEVTKPMSSSQKRRLLRLKKRLETAENEPKTAEIEQKTDL
ncbi:ATP-dependent RNA helicase DDX24-like [Dreissena polymorpha]|nr:ATP-dependent RNA helicase DDX24-like [Dreissena polymorpha]